MQEKSEEPRYLSYLLRLWPVNAGGQAVWRASLESSMTGDRTGFSDLETLFTFIEETLQNIKLDEPAEIEKDIE